MKKFPSLLKALLPLLLLSLLLSACNNGAVSFTTVITTKDGNSIADQSFGLSAGDLAQTILDSGAFSEELELLDNEIAYMLFGFDLWSDSASLIEDSVVYYSTGGTSEICAVLVIGEEYYGGDMAAADSDLEDWLAAQIEAEKDYRPAEVPKLENAILEERGNTILLVVANDAEAAQAAIPAQ